MKHRSRAGADRAPTIRPYDQLDLPEPGMLAAEADDCDLVLTQSTPTGGRLILPAELLIQRYHGEAVVPKQLRITAANRRLPPN